MKVLLLGSGGQLGWELQRTCPLDIDLIAYDHSQVDFNEEHRIEACILSSDPDWIINAAAYTAVDKAEEEKELARQINHKAVAQIAQTAKAGQKKLIQISTDFIFDGQSCKPYCINSQPCPISVYGQTKLDGENTVKQILKDDATIIRTAWLYSSHGNNFVKTMLKLMKEKECLQVVDDQIGTPTWAYGLAGYVWTGLAANFSGTFHWTDAGVASWYDFAVAIQEEAIGLGLLDKNIPVHPIPAAQYPPPAQRPQFSVLDKTDVWQGLGITPVHWRVQLRKMLKELV